MDIKMQYGHSPSELDYSGWEVGFFGNAIDDRGVKAIEFLKENAKTIVRFQYLPKEFKVSISGHEIDKDDIDDQIAIYSGMNIILDSTTLNFAEMLILIQAFRNVKNVSFDVLYIEPGDYNRKHKTNEILHKRDFELSEGNVGYEAIPGHALLITNEVNQKVIFLCGFESERVDRAIEDSQINGANCSCIFGVPAFCSGWEMDSFDNNISVIKEKKLTGGVNFCGATDPLSVYQRLNLIYMGLENDDQMFVAPLSTKPMNLGACLFLVTKPKDRVAALYDHPNEMKGRGLKISKWHLFNVILN